MLRANSRTPFRAWGGKPGTGGSLAGTLHRGWVDVRLSIRGRTDHGILAECEKVEEVAKERYEAALAAGLTGATPCLWRFSRMARCAMRRPARRRTLLARRL